MTRQTKEGGEAVLECKSLSVGYRRALLPPIDLTLRAGRFIAVVGRNGSGKTTWFKTLLGLVPPLSGRIERRRGVRLAYVPQSITLERHLPVRAGEVVAWGTLRGFGFLRALGRAEDRLLVNRALAEAGAADLRDHWFYDLSKGQRQRVLFARMLASNPDLALLDEPTAAMDAEAEQAAITRMASLCRDRKMTVVCVTHSLQVARTHADDVLLFDRRNQEVVFGPREEVLAHPAYSTAYEGADLDA